MHRYMTRSCQFVAQIMIHIYAAKYSTFNIFFVNKILYLGNCYDIFSKQVYYIQIYIQQVHNYSKY